MPGTKIEGLSTRQATLQLQWRSEADVLDGPAFGTKGGEDGLPLGFTFLIPLRGFVH